MDEIKLIEALCQLLRATPAEVVTLIRRGPYQYKHYQIDKRTGGKRDIYHPSPNLKAVQRWLTSEYFSKLPVHDQVYSYRAGYCIRDHAKEHLHSNFILRLDFKNFFPSIDSRWVSSFLLENTQNKTLQLSEKAIQCIIRLVCRFNSADKSLALSIGAPSSPSLSNTILFRADSEAADHCSKLGCVYSRYADDIYVSSREKGVLNEAERLVRATFSNLAPRLSFNERKTLNVSKKSRRLVTGLTVTPDRKISIGRNLKRSIKTQIYLHTTGQLIPENLPRLCGLISYAHDVEPSFFEALSQKFGNETLESLYRNGSTIG